MFFKIQRRGDTSFLNYFFTFILVVFGTMAFQTPLMLYVIYRQDQDPSITDEMVEQFYSTGDFSLINADLNMGLVLMILGFLGAIIGLFVGVRFAHRNNIRYLITAKEHINWSKILFGFGLWFLVSMVLFFIDFGLNPDTFKFQFDPLKFMILFVIAIFFLPIQTSCEELLMRGYLMPAIGFIAKNKWVPWILTSLIFAALHGANPEVDKFGAGYMAFYYIGSGLFLGIITVMDDSLELALGVHAANNIFACLFLTFEGSAIQTDALFSASTVNPIMTIVFFILSASVFYSVCHRKYGWPSIAYVFEKLTFEDEAIDHQEHYKTDEIL